MKIKRLDSPLDTFDLCFPEAKPFDVVGFGINSVDQVYIVPEYPRPDSKCEILRHETMPGGQIATAVKFISRMGLKAKYIGKVGGDHLGKFALESLRSENIDTRSVIVQKNATNQYAIIIIDRNDGERTILCHRDNRLDFGTNELDDTEICCGRILHLDGYDSAAALKAASICHERGIPVCIDLDKVVPDCKALMENIDFLIVSSCFPRDFTGIADPLEAFCALRQYCSGFIAVTLGARGAMAWVGEKCVAFPGLSVEAVDTTGAGDIFHGGFIYGLLQNWPLQRIMNFANAAAGLSCMYLGAQSGIRPYPEILQHLDSSFPETAR